MPRKIAHIVYLDADQAEWLRQESAVSGIAATEIVRRLIDHARGTLLPRSDAPDPSFTGEVCPGRSVLQIAAEDARGRGLITDEQYEAQIGRLEPPANKWTNMRVLRDFQQAPGAEVTLEIAREVLREEYPNASVL